MRIAKSPALMLLLGFFGIILAGTVILSLPFMREPGTSYSFLNIIFTATSCVCVTGLSVVTISSYFSTIGQIFIMLLIQIGGLGYMTVASLLFTLIGKKMSVNERLATQSSVGQLSMEGLADFVKYIVKITLVLEGIGALILAVSWFPRYGFKSIYLGIFHAISAFCNAGFTLFPDSLASFSGNYLAIGVIMLLIVLGGIGFLVVRDVFIKRKLSYHSRLILVFTAILIIVPWIIFFVTEYNNFETIGHFSLFKKLIVSLFHSITTRTAGFNIIQIKNVVSANIFVFILLMFIGASPAGTGGGIKVSTFAVLFFSVKSMFKGSSDVNIMKRRVSKNVIQKSWVVMFASFWIIAIFFFGLLIVDSRNFEFQKILFEVFSAFGTVGLSMGITENLSSLSKVFIMIVMFLGRLGPLLMSTGLFLSYRHLKYKYAEGEVLIG